MLPKAIKEHISLSLLLQSCDDFENKQKAKIEKYRLWQLFCSHE